MTNQWLVQMREKAGENAGENNDVHSLGRRREEAGFHPAVHGSRGSLTAARTAQAPPPLASPVPSGPCMSRPFLPHGFL